MNCILINIEGRDCTLHALSVIMFNLPVASYGVYYPTYRILYSLATYFVNIPKNQVMEVLLSCYTAA